MYPGGKSGARDMKIVVSLFPGIDMLGRAFEEEGFCVVRGPDKIFGGDIRSFHIPPNRVDGIIGGPPCQDFSSLNRNPGDEGLELLGEYMRVVDEAKPDWFLIENVSRVPDVSAPGYTVQRFDLNALNCGMRQSRLRHFQFGSRRGFVLIPQRLPRLPGPIEPICTASEGEKADRRTWSDFCSLQGLPRDFDLPGWSTASKYRAVGNGVPIPMGRIVARAVINANIPLASVRLCSCGCGRVLEGNQVMATPACRKRMQRRRDRSIEGRAGYVTV